MVVVVLVVVLVDSSLVLHTRHVGCRVCWPSLQLQQCRAARQGRQVTTGEQTKSMCGHASAEVLGASTRQALRNACRRRQAHPPNPTRSLGPTRLTLSHGQKARDLGLLAHERQWANAK